MLIVAHTLSIDNLQSCLLWGFDVLYELNPSQKDVRYKPQSSMPSPEEAASASVSPFSYACISFSFDAIV